MPPGTRVHVDKKKEKSKKWCRIEGSDMSRLKFVFIDDDRDSAERWLRWAADAGYRYKHAESALEAVKIVADFYVFDISAISGILSPEKAYSPICSIAERHPGAMMVIVSGIAKGCVEDVIEDVFDACGVRPLYGGWGKHEDFEAAIKDYLG